MGQPTLTRLSFLVSVTGKGRTDRISHSSLLEGEETIVQSQKLGVIQSGVGLAAGTGDGEEAFERLGVASKAVLEEERVGRGRGRQGWQSLGGGSTSLATQGKVAREASLT